MLSLTFAAAAAVGSYLGTLTIVQHVIDPLLPAGEKNAVLGGFLTIAPFFATFYGGKLGLHLGRKLEDGPTPPTGPA